MGKSVASPWKISVYGGLRLTRSATDEDVNITSKKARAVLLLLAMQPNHTMTRSRLLGLLWSERSESLARQSLRQALSDLRRAFNGAASDILVANDEQISLRSSAFDVDWRALAQSGQGRDNLIKAVDAYRGPLAANLEIQDENFNEWLTREREHHRDLAIQRLTELIQTLAGEGNLDLAFKQSLRLLDLDPLREQTHRTVLSLESAVSGRASALARYEDLKALLLKELGVAPEAATKALVNELLLQPEIPLNITATLDHRPLIPQKRRLKAIAILGGLFLCAALALAAIAFRSDSPIEYVAEREGRISLAVLHFQSLSTDPNVELAARDLREILIQKLVTIPNFAIVQATEYEPSPDMARSLRARYVLAGSVAAASGDNELRVRVLDTQTMDPKFANTSALLGFSDARTRAKAANILARTMFKELVLDRAKNIAENERETTGSMLIRAEAAFLQGRFGPLDDNERQLFEQVLDRDPNNYLALKGLSRHLVTNVAMERSTNRDEDLKLAETILDRLDRMYPNNVNSIFIRAMIAKVRRRYEQALQGFERAIELDTTYPQAQVQRAHLLMLLGQPDEAFEIMRDELDSGPKDVSIGSLAYLAAETALQAERDEDAVRWLRLAVQENPSIGRTQALLAAALEVTGRTNEATEAARKARALSSNYTPDVLRRRGGREASAVYRKLQTRYVGAYAAAFERANSE